MNGDITDPERILLAGLFGGGKSHSWLTTLDLAYNNDDDIKFYVIATERGAVTRMKSKYTEQFDKLVEYRDCKTWYELQDWTDEILSKQRPGDIIVIEGMDKPWDFVQALWDKLYGPPLSYDPKDPFAMERGMLDDSGSVGRDWVKIRTVYENWLDSIFQTSCHVFACTPSEPLKMPTGKAKEWKDDPEVIEQFSRFGVKPAGNKKLGHHFHTILLCRNPRAGVWTITSMDDHTRELLDNTPITNFVFDYLVKIAGWEL